MKVAGPSPIQRARGAKAGLAAAACTLIFLAGAGIVFVVMQLNGLRSELSAVSRELISAKERLGRLEQKAEQPTVSDRFATLEAKQAHGRSRIALELSREEIQIVRDYIKVPPAPPGTPGTIELGSVVPPAILAPLPQPIVDKFARLVGARFTTDKNGAIVIVGRGSRYADAIVGPN